MKQIHLTNSNTPCIVDDEDYIELSKYRWCICNTKIVTTSRPYFQMSRLILGIIKSSRHNFKVVDHINSNIFDNRRSNLRQATTKQNARNQVISKNNVSGYKGVSFHKKLNKWRSVIYLSGKQYSLGCFQNIIEAAIAYDDAAIKYFGEFAKLNFPLYGA